MGRINSPHQSKNEKFLRIKWKFGCKVCSKNGRHSVSFLKPNGQQTEYSCSTYGSKKSTPIITYSKISCRYFDAEQHTYENTKKIEIVTFSLHELELVRPITNLQPVHQNMNQHRLHMQRPTFHNVSIHFRRLLEMMSPFCSTIEPQYWQCARMDPENRNINIYLHAVVAAIVLSHELKIDMFRIQSVLSCVCRRDH